MKEVPKTLQRQFDRMERKKKNFLDLLSTVAPEKYHLTADAKTWSPGQVGNHLLLSERLSHLYMRKKLSYPDTVPPFHPKSWAGVLLYRLVLNSPIKVKAPAAINMWDKQDILPFETLVEKWTASRKDMFEFIMEKYPVFPDHLVYKHPFAGRLTFVQALMFFGDHIDHHTRQLKRIIQRL
jgi:hypothetical protein